MATKILLAEKSATAPVKSGNRWKGILAVPGQGASGFYSEAVLREFGPAAMPPGSKAFLEHDPARKVRDMIGTYPDGAHYEEGVGLVGELEVFSHWKTFVEEVGPHAALSIYMMGESDDDGNVTALHYDIQNGTDMVSYPGLAGSGLAEKLYESAHASAQAENGPATAVSQSTQEEREPSTMELSELASKVDTLVEAVTALTGVVTPLAESLKPEVKPEVDVAAVVESAYDASLTAKLPESMRKVVIEAAKSGGDITAAVADQVKLRDEILAESAVEQRQVEGYVHGKTFESAVDLGKAFG